MDQGAADTARDRRQTRLLAVLERAERLAGLGSWEWDCGTGRVTWSEGMYRIYGRDPATYRPEIGFLHELTHPDDRRPELRFVAVEDGAARANRFEQRVLRPDGTVCHVTAQYEARLDGGELASMTGFVQDISHLHRTEEMLRRRLAVERAVASIARRLLEGGPDVIDAVARDLLDATATDHVRIVESFVDGDGRARGRIAADVAARSPDGTAATGDDPELDGGCWDEVGFGRWQVLLSAKQEVRGLVRHFPPREREILQRRGVRSLLVLPIHAEDRWRGFIGLAALREETVWNSDDVLLLRAAADMLSGHLTLRAAQERVARLSVERVADSISRVSEGATDLIWTADLDLRFTFVGDAVRRITGREPTWSLGRGPEALVSPESAAAVRQLAEDEIARDREGDGEPGRTWTVEVAVRRDDGSPVPCRITTTFLRDGDGRPVGFVGVARALAFGEQVSGVRHKV